MKSKLLGTVLVASALMPVAAFADPGPTITVVPTLAPNAFGSPSYNGWVSNSIQALIDDVATAGTPGTPTYYEARDTVTTAQAIVTGFPSWMGKADPGSVYGPAFAAELGNRMLFGLRIDGNGSQFSINQLSFSAVSTDPFNALAFGFGAGAYTYSNQYVGLLKGDDGILFTADDIWVTGGASDQLVDGLVGRGSGSSFAAYCPGCTVAEQQAAINAAAYYPGFDFQFTGTYSLGGASGSGTFNLTAVPEPASWAMMIGGFALAGGAMRRQRKALRFA